MDVKTKSCLLFGHTADVKDSHICPSTVYGSVKPKYHGEKRKKSLFAPRRQKKIRCELYKWFCWIVRGKSHNFVSGKSQKWPHLDAGVIEVAGTT